MLMLFFTEAPSTLAALISAMPIINAPAVVDVRRGLRIALRRPRRPGTPRWNGALITRTTGRAISGESTVTPRKMSTAPMPTSEIELRKPGSSAATPSTSRTPPMIAERTSDALGKTASRSAATGGMRDARKAGTSAASAVIPMPTAYDAMNVRGANTMAPCGMSPPPIAFTSGGNPAANPTPTARPIVVPTAPMTTASTSTDRITCPRPAPKARKSASSRNFCASSVSPSIRTSPR